MISAFQDSSKTNDSEYFLYTERIVTIFFFSKILENEICSKHSEFNNERN